MNNAILECSVDILKAGHDDKIIGVVDEIFHDESRIPNDKIAYYQNISLQMLVSAFRILLEFNVNTKDLAYDQSVFMEKLLKIEKVEEMKSMIITYYQNICAYTKIKRNIKSNSVVEKTKHIINTRYHENSLSINAIAREVYLSHPHLCLIFKQECGETIKDYLTQKRIERAKDLLADEDNKLYDISERVGYLDASYFTKQFKKYTGLTPSQYRKTICR